MKEMYNTYKNNVGGEWGGGGGGGGGGGRGARPRRSEGLPAWARAHPGPKRELIKSGALSLTPHLCARLREARRP